MITRKVTILGMLLAGLSLSLGAHAEKKRYLVQFKSSGIYYAAAQRLALISAHQNSVDGEAVKLFNSNATVTDTLHNVQTMIVESDDALAMQALRSHPDIALIEPEFFHPAPAPIGTHSGEVSDAPPPSIAADMEVPWGITAVKAPQAWTITKGDTARVMVLDTGLDKAHPALMGRFEEGQNFTGGDKTNITDEIGHGTHVSGTILADGLNGSLVGVAPQSKLLMGKVCSSIGCSNVAIIAGIDWSVTKKVDVVNMSLGGAFLSTAEGKALERAEAAGVMVVAASGNDGQAKVSFPAAAPSVFAVGALDSALKKATFSNWGPELDIMGPGVDTISSVPRGTGRNSAVKVDLGGKGLNDVKSMSMTGVKITAATTNDLVFANLGKPADFSNVNVRGKFALISRGEIPFAEKVKNSLRAGATGVVIYNNTSGLLQGSVSEDGSEVQIPVVMIEQAVGEDAKALLQAGKSARASVAIVTTDYAAFQGTSMATPHVAGVAALVRATNKTLTPVQVRDLLKATATALTPNDANQFGSGLVNAEAAVMRAQATHPFQFQVAN